jgi:hypothetical protein
MLSDICTLVAENSSMQLLILKLIANRHEIWRVTMYLLCLKSSETRIRVSFSANFLGLCFGPPYLFIYCKCRSRSTAYVTNMRNNCSVILCLCNKLENGCESATKSYGRKGRTVDAVQPGAPPVVPPYSPSTFDFLRSWVRK